MPMCLVVNSAAPNRALGPTKSLSEWEHSLPKPVKRKELTHSLPAGVRMRKGAPEKATGQTGRDDYKV